MNELFIYYIKNLQFYFELSTSEKVCKYFDKIIITKIINNIIILIKSYTNY